MEGIFALACLVGDILYLDKINARAVQAVNTPVGVLELEWRADDLRQFGVQHEYCAFLGQFKGAAKRANRQSII